MGEISWHTSESLTLERLWFSYTLYAAINLSNVVYEFISEFGVQYNISKAPVTLCRIAVGAE